MPALKNIFKPSRKSHGGAPTPELQQSNLGVSQPSSTSFSSGSYTSSLSLASSNVSPPRESLYSIYEGPNSSYNTAELDGWAHDQSRHSVQSRPIQPQRSRQNIYDPNANEHGWPNVNRTSLPAQSRPTQPQQSPPRMAYGSNPYGHGWPNVDRSQPPVRPASMSPPAREVSISPLPARHESMSPPTTRQVSISPSPSRPLSAAPPPYDARESMHNVRHGLPNTNVQEPQIRDAVIANDYANRGKSSADAERRALQREQDASADTIRQLRELIRERYALDLYVWDKREAHKANRKIILPMCKKADHILQQIYWIVNSWERESFDDEEWEIAEKIKASLKTGYLENGDSNEPAYWDSLPPWERVEGVEDMRMQYSSRR